MTTSLRASTTVTYRNVDAVENDDGNLRIYRRRGLLGLLRRQDVFHPRGSWRDVTLNDIAVCTVTLGDRHGGTIDG